MNYSKEAIEKMGGGELTREQIDKVYEAISGFVSMFGKTWVDKYLRWDEHACSLTGMISDREIEECFRTYSLPLLHLILLWEDWLLIKDLSGADELKEKLSVGERNQNVDFEISTAADLCRGGATLEFIKRKKGEHTPDYKFRLNNSEWIYVEVSKRISSQGFESEKKALAKEAGETAKRISPGAFGTIILFDWNQYSEVMKWLKELNSTNEKNLERLDDIAAFFMSQAGGYDPTRALELINYKPHFYATQDGSIVENTFGTMWSHIPDFNGCKNKICEEKEQLPLNEQGIIVVDVTGIAGAFTDWVKVIQEELFSLDEYEKVSAIVLIKSEAIGKVASFPMRKAVTAYNKNTMNTLTIPEREWHDIFSRNI